MAASETQVLRILVVHADAATRASLEESLRRLGAGPVTAFGAASLAAGLESAGRLEPRVVLLDLSEEPALALEVARQIRRPDRLIVGLYNPLVLAETEARFLRRAARAGVGDFVPLPCADSELRDALARAPATADSPRPRAEGRLISFTSHKGGVGTTTLAVNCALLLAGSRGAERGVAFCDAAVQLGTASALLGLVPDRDLADLVRDLEDLAAVPDYLTAESKTGLRVLASPRDPRDAAAVSPQDLSRVLIGLRQRFGIVVVDCPTTLDLLTLAALDLSELIFVVTEAVASTVLATARYLQLLDRHGFGAERVRVVLNRHANPERYLSERRVAEHLGRPLDHLVPFNEAVILAANAGLPLVLSDRKSSFSEAVGRLAQDILGGLRTRDRLLR